MKRDVCRIWSVERDFLIAIYEYCTRYSILCGLASLSPPINLSFDVCAQEVKNSVHRKSDVEIWDKRTKMDGFEWKITVQVGKIKPHGVGSETTIRRRLKTEATTERYNSYGHKLQRMQSNWIELGMVYEDRRISICLSTRTHIYWLWRRN